MIKTSFIIAAAFLSWFALPLKKESHSTNSSALNAKGKIQQATDSAGLKAGEKFPDLVFKDTAGKDVKVSDLKGKYIYIDIWASWCYPCRKEYPVLAALRDRMKNKKIAFVGISCDTRDFRWKGAMGFEKMSGTQWIIKDEAFMAAFHVATVPRYILLDKKGTIINPNMSRPSKPETEIALNALKGI